MQTKTHSLLESITNIVIGLVINITAQFLVFPLFDIYIDPHENLMITGIFTIISLANVSGFLGWYNYKSMI